MASFAPKSEINLYQKEQIKQNQRNNISMRRMEYSNKVKGSTATQKQKIFKNKISKIIIIQKWVRGFLLRNFLSNISECEKIMDSFIKLVKKYIFEKFEIFKKIKNFNPKKGLFKQNNDNISISLINTNNTNTFTNHNTFSLCQDTADIFENDNRTFIINKKRNGNPSIRELLMPNSDKVKNKRDSNNQNIYNLKLNNSKKYERAKNLNDLKKISDQRNMNINNNIINNNYLSLQNNYKNEYIGKNQILDLKKKSGTKSTNLRFLLFSQKSNNKQNLEEKDNEKIYKKPINDLLFISKISYFNSSPCAIFHSKSEKKLIPKIYNLSLIYNENEDNNKNNKNNVLFDNMIIDEIKEAKEDEEEDSQSLNEGLYYMTNSFFQIKSSFSFQKSIFFILLLKKQIMFNIKTHIFSILKKYCQNFCNINN
jgi:hypothetical protein